MLLAVIAAFLGGCIGQQQPGSSADGYVGRSIAEYVADHGEPDSTIPLSDHRSLFRWDLAAHAMGPAIGTGLTTSGPPASSVLTLCSVTLAATTQTPNPGLKDWIIQSSDRHGVC
jgi:hypothetical protein